MGNGSRDRVQQAETLRIFRASLDKAEQPFECLHWSARAGQFPEGMVQELFVCNPEVNTHPSDLL